jgi:hypothetical protein
MNPPYNDLDGIAAYLTDLEGLNRLVEDRRQAKKNGERLDDFCVMGRWRLEQGNCSPLGGKHDKAPYQLGTLPPVVTWRHLEIFMRDDSIVTTSAWPFPPHYSTCDVCGEKWTIENALDFIQDQYSEKFSLEGFVGQPLQSVTQIPELVNRKWHRVLHDMIYSDHHPEGSKTREVPDGSRWRYVDKDYIVQAGDRASVQLIKFTHKACYQRAGELNVRTSIEQCFAQAGFSKVNLITRKNEYCPCDICTPWYTAQTGGCPPFTIGWRKSVINVDWSETGISLPDLFEGEPVTRGNHYIHAHGYEKLTQYLTKLLPALGAKRDT